MDTVSIETIMYIIKTFFEYGVIGAVAVLFLLLFLKEKRERNKEHIQHAEDLKAFHTRYEAILQAETKALTALVKDMEHEHESN